jgi:glycerol-3-phosphate cytidylyltransferase
MSQPVTGYTTGVYDMFHVGHLRVLQRARAECEHLIVGVTTDELAQARKNKTPIIPFSERVEILQSLRCVDSVVAQATMDKLVAWEQHRFDKMFVGDDWKGTPAWNALEEVFAARSVEIVYFPYTQHTSSTQLRAVLEKLHGDVEG